LTRLIDFLREITFVVAALYARPAQWGPPVPISRNGSALRAILERAGGQPRNGVQRKKYSEAARAVKAQI
jgi:hypothetical protein